MRGIILANRRTFVVTTYGEEGWQEVLAALPPQARTKLSGSIRGGEWYGVPLNEQLDRAICTTLGGNDPSTYLRMGAASAERLLPEAYPFAVGSRQPLVMLRALRQGGARHWDPIVVEHQEVTPTHYRVRFSGFISNEPNCVSNIGFFTHAVELCGGRDVVVTESSCTRSGGAEDCYEICWEPPLPSGPPRSG